MKAMLIGLVSFYKRWISPALPSACRFQPTCSEYAREAIEAHGPARGSWLALRRLLRCHPLGSHGYDPVPLPLNTAAGSCSHIQNSGAHIGGSAERLARP